jgi:predicted esterase
MVTGFNAAVAGVALLAVALVIGVAPQLVPNEPGIYIETVDNTLTPVKSKGDYEAPQDRFERKQFEFSNRPRYWYGMGDVVNAAIEPEKRPPLIILLHGAKRDGRSMLDMWKETASANGLTLIAPDALNANEWDGHDDSAEFFQALMDEASKTMSFNPKRVYLFGHSAGAIHALGLGNREDGPWLAVAVHAGGLQNVKTAATNPGIPMRIYLGDKDEQFSVDSVRAQAKELADAGHKMELIVIENHDHWFYKIGPRLSSEAWNYFKQFEPRPE